MGIIATNEFKSGAKVLLDGQPHSIIENEAVKPGKGQAFNRVKLRNLISGRVIERTFKSGDTLETADVADVEVQYLYNDGTEWHFMQNESFEQYQIRAEVLGDTMKWLKEQDTCVLTLFNGVPLSIDPPNSVILTITETDPGLRGDTSGGGGKPATLETGAVVRVPLFVQIGDVIKVDTRTGEYIGRANK